MAKYMSDDKLFATIVANFIGGCMFFFVDKWIFSKKEQVGIVAGLTPEQERNHPCYDEKKGRIV